MALTSRPFFLGVLGPTWARRMTEVRPCHVAQEIVPSRALSALLKDDSHGLVSQGAFGTLELAEYQPAAKRFIPTPVGNTRPSSSPTRWPPVHPHARGEHRQTLLNKIAAVGSSPRPWGTQKRSRASATRARFIPTPVGNTVETGDALRLQIGSSPRPWGTPGSARPDSASSRFIPTPVGNTTYSPSAGAM